MKKPEIFGKSTIEEKSIEIKGTMSALSARIRQIEVRIAEERIRAKDAIRRENKEEARSYLTIAAEYEERRARYHQQFTTLENSLMNIEEAKDQTQVLKAFEAVNTVLALVNKVLSPGEIQIQIDKLTQSLDKISLAGELLSEDLMIGETDVDTEALIDTKMEALEAELLLEKEKAIPALELETETKVEIVDNIKEVVKGLKISEKD
jgi:hypothetical protein